MVLEKTSACAWQMDISIRDIVYTVYILYLFHLWRHFLQLHAKVVHNCFHIISYYCVRLLAVSCSHVTTCFHISFFVMQSFFNGCKYPTIYGIHISATA